MNNTYVYIAVMFITSYLVRVLPLTVFRRPIQSRFVRSFLYYVPYVTLSLMTFPAIVEATRSPLAGALALAAGIAAAWLGAGLLPVAVICCAVVLAAEGIIV
ncbi:MAG: AzlD domain-containing protein [Firmicutes bacterium]|nr:AzlD domain-containing protein [Bacillota bacterium]